ncbi:MAG: hypothetical protein HY652_15165, partial [Acidobacteria bacterium]|nr:hypothetical protein [Acidobacteriota bacterium]
GGERREGGYHSIAERLFSTLNHNRLLLEYDDPQRTGGFEPLRFIPRAKVVALGLVSTKVATIESMGELKRRIEGLPPAPPARPQPSVWVRGRHGQQDHERRGPVAQARPRGRNRCTDLGAGGLPPRRKILTRRAPFLRLLGAPVVQWPHGT